MAAAMLAQVCAEDPIILAHAVPCPVAVGHGDHRRALDAARLPQAVTSTSAMRNLMGQVDGTVQPAAAELEQSVWIGADGPGPAPAQRRSLVLRRSGWIWD